jgi:hypothetical protein
MGAKSIKPIIPFLLLFSFRVLPLQFCNLFIYDLKYVKHIFEELAKQCEKCSIVGQPTPGISDIRRIKADKGHRIKSRIIQHEQVETYKQYYHISTSW